MFKINGIYWQIYTVPYDSAVLIREDGSRTIGMCDNYLKTIYLSDSLNEEMAWKVLCHELTHAAIYSYNIYLTEEQEELVANFIATYGEKIIETTNKVFKGLKNQFQL